MANKTLIDILEKGVTTWNEWKTAQAPALDVLSMSSIEVPDDELWIYVPPDLPYQLDLGGADLSNLRLRNVDFSGVNLNGADLTNSDLWNADLSNSSLINANLRRATLISADLSNSSFENADLRQANLNHAQMLAAKFTNANLSKAQMHDAKLLRANLNSANLSGANLSSSYLGEVDLTDATLMATDLRNSNLEGATLVGTRFVSTNLNEANLSDTILRSTIWNDVDLSNVKGLDTAHHLGASLLGIETFYKSQGHLPNAFLVGCGVPDGFITFLPSLIGAQRAIQFDSCFISYSHHDEEFVRKLYSQMRHHGMRVWYAPEDLKGGRKLYEQISEAIQVHDKLLVILSEHSLTSEWVMTEIRRARKTEVQENRRKLFPIRLVSMDVINRWECFDSDSGKDLAVEVREYYIPEFSQWRDTSTFDEMFRRLMSDLQNGETKLPLTF